MAIDPINIVSAAKEIIKSGPVAGSISETWAAVVGDRIASWRLVNAAKLQLKVQTEFKKLGLKPSIDKIPERYAITWFEEASKQDEDEIQDLFARLLARAAAEDDDALDRRNIEIVSKLTPNDAALFLEMAEGGWGAKRYPSRLHWVETGQFFSRSPTKVHADKFSRSYEHLITLGLLSRQTNSEEKVKRSFNQGAQVRTIINNVVILSDTGISVYNAIREINK